MWPKVILILLRPATHTEKLQEATSLEIIKTTSYPLLISLLACLSESCHLSTDIKPRVLCFIPAVSPGCVHCVTMCVLVNFRFLKDKDKLMMVFTNIHLQNHTNLIQG